jgi:tetratricopeptide (TPR) repeat protein
VDSKTEPQGFQWTRARLFGALLVLVTVPVYLPAMAGPFVFDDPLWTTQIAELHKNLSGLWTLWTQPSVLQQYFPLTATSFWLDYHLWNFWTPGYHLENVLLHCASAFLFWKILERLEVPCAWLAALIFALHPSMVESAAWISERKNVLSLVLYLGALLYYGNLTAYWKSPEVLNRRGDYAMALLLFVGALLAKTTAFSLPIVLLLLCWWKRGRIRWREDFLPTVPFFVIALVFGMGTSWIEQHRGGTQGADWAIPSVDRLLIAGKAFWFYLGKLIWPTKLCLIYPRWHIDARSAAQWVYPITAVGTLLGIWFARSRVGRGPVTAVFFFVATIFPFIGFMNTYFMRYSFVCDHWAYLPSLGLIALVAGSVGRIADRLGSGKIAYSFGAVLLPVLALLTWRQAGIYRSGESLWSDTIAKNPDSFIVQLNYGEELRDNGQLDEAIAHFRRALELRPDLAEAYVDVGVVQLKKGDGDAAILAFQKAVALRPDLYVAWFNLGQVFLDQGRVDKAIECLEKSLELRPQFGRTRDLLDRARLQKRQLDEAVGRLQAMLKSEPNDAAAHRELGSLLMRKGQEEDAIIHLEKAVELQPTNVYALNTLAWVRATCPEARFRNGPEAVRFAEQASQLTDNKEPTIIGTLAAAYAEAGRFGDAIGAAQKARDLALSLGQNDLANKNGELIRMFEKKQAYREPSLF